MHTRARFTAIAAAVLLVLSACSDEAESSDDDNPGREVETVLEELEGDRLCELLPAATLEASLDVTVTESNGESMGKPPFRHATCRYDVEFDLMEVEVMPPGVTIIVGQTETRTIERSVDEVLDRVFADLLNEEDDDAVGDYDLVDGLGKGAGYGDDPIVDETKILAVVFDLADEQLLLEIDISPDATLDQMRPLASDLLAALDAELS